MPDKDVVDALQPEPSAQAPCYELTFVVCHGQALKVHSSEEQSVCQNDVGYDQPAVKAKSSQVLFEQL